MNRFNTEALAEESAVRSTVAEQNAGQGAGRDAQQDAYIDYRKLHYKNTIPDNRILVFLTGFCVGMIFFYLTGGKNAGVGSLLDSEQLTLMQNFEVNRLGLLEYVVSLRFRQLILGVICSLSSVGALLAYSIMGWCGFELGLMIFSLVYQYGMKGILLTFSMFLPHGIFYGIIFLIIFRKYWGSNKKCCHNEETIKKERRHQKIEAVKIFVLVLLFFCVGILCEVYINPEIMRKVVLLF
ncbi:MAG: stage II sporulation protein M [Lachnospiraceae bacterium]|nr:stage II sporulation protein M [Lachnospiraceae bacterium]